VDQGLSVSLILELASILVGGGFALFLPLPCFCASWKSLGSGPLIRARHWGQLLTRISLI